MPGGKHHVVVLALENVLALDIGIPLQVFGSWPDGPYSLTVCAERPGLVAMHGGPALSVADGLDALATADTVIVPGYLEPDTPSAAVSAALAQAAAACCPSAWARSPLPPQASSTADGPPRTGSTRQHWRSSTHR
jgi:hypothetical protein